MTCSCSPVHVILVLFDKEEEQKRSQRTLILVIREREITERTREREIANQKTNGLVIYTMNTHRLWSPCSFCSASRRNSCVEQAVVLSFLLLPRMCCSSSFFFSWCVFSSDGFAPSDETTRGETARDTFLLIVYV